MTIVAPKLDLTTVNISHIQSKGCVDKFRCGVPEIDKWVKDKAVKFHDRGRAKVFVAKGPNSTLGFYSLSFSTENNSKLAKSEDRDAWKDGAPLMYIDYVAVQSHIQGNRLGEMMLINALSRANMVSAHVAFFGVALRSLNDRTTKLYYKFGFRVAPDEDRHPLMILPIWSVNDLFKQE